MSSNLNINPTQRDLTAPTPQNTPLTHAPIAAGLSRPTVPDIREDPEGAEDDADTAAAEAAEQLGEAMQAGALQGALAGMVQTRLSELVGRSSGYIEALPVEAKRTLAALHGVQAKQSELMTQFKREVWELERKVRGSPVFCCAGARC